MFDGVAARWTHMLYGLLNGMAAAYGIAVFVGLGNSRDDLRARLATWRQAWPQLGRLPALSRSRA